MPRRFLSKITATTQRRCFSPLYSLRSYWQRTRPKSVHNRARRVGHALRAFGGAGLRGRVHARHPARHQHRRAALQGAAPDRAARAPGEGETPAPAPLVLRPKSSRRASSVNSSASTSSSTPRRRSSRTTSTRCARRRRTSRASACGRARRSSTRRPRRSSTRSATRTTPVRPARVITAALAGPTQDIVSAIYFLRTPTLTPGQSFDIANQRLGPRLSGSRDASSPRRRR